MNIMLTIPSWLLMVHTALLVILDGESPLMNAFSIVLPVLTLFWGFPRVYLWVQLRGWRHMYCANTIHVVAVLDCKLDSALPSPALNPSRFNRNGHLKFHMERLHNQETARKCRAPASQQQTIIVNNEEVALATLQCRDTQSHTQHNTRQSRQLPPATAATKHPTQILLYINVGFFNAKKNSEISNHVCSAVQL